MLKSFLNGYFGFNRQQRNGLMVLLIISFILLVIRIALPYFIQPGEIVIQNLPLLPIEKPVKKSDFKIEEKKADAISELFVFNPNQVSLEQLIQLGFREKKAKTFIKFRSKGFQFKKKEDLKKIYGISDQLYERLLPYILIQQKSKSEKPKLNKENIETKIKETVAQNKTISLKIEINKADTQQLMTCPEIDLSAAKRIIKFRNRLGGFVSINQLMEVYGFDEDFYRKIKSNLIVDANQVKKINPNKETFYSLNKHPYISYELAKKILDWRKKTTLNPTNFAELIDNSEMLAKLSPYLLFD